MIDVPLAATFRGKLFAKIDGRECFETSQSRQSVGMLSPLHYSVGTKMYFFGSEKLLA